MGQCRPYRHRTGRAACIACNAQVAAPPAVPRGRRARSATERDAGMGAVRLADACRNVSATVYRGQPCTRRPAGRHDARLATVDRSNRPPRIAVGSRPSDGVGVAAQRRTREGRMDGGRYRHRAHRRSCAGDAGNTADADRYSDRRRHPLRRHRPGARSRPARGRAGNTSPVAGRDVAEAIRNADDAQRQGRG